MKFLMQNGWVVCLAGRLVRIEGPQSVMAKAVGADFKGKLSLLMYVLGIVLSFWNSWVSEAIYVGVAMMWLIPDRRIERELHNSR